MRGEGTQTTFPSAETGLRRALDDAVSSPGIFTSKHKNKEAEERVSGPRYRPSRGRRLKDHVPGRSRRSSHHILQIQPRDINIFHAHSPFSLQFSLPLRFPGILGDAFRRCGVVEVKGGNSINILEVILEGGGRRRQGRVWGQREGEGEGGGGV